MDAFFGFRANEWEELARRDEGNWGLPGAELDGSSVEGRVAYAREQSSQFTAMRNHCRKLWKDVDTYVQTSGRGTELVSDKVQGDEDDEEKGTTAEYGAYD